MGKITGFLEIERHDRKSEPVADRIQHYREFVLPLPEQELRGQAARCMDCGVPYCHGPTGRNFAAGMSGGIAYVLDEDGSFESRCNLAMVELEPVPQEEQIAEQEFGHYNDLEAHGRVDVMADMTAKDAERLHLLISKHARYTGSTRAAEILADWSRYRPLFRKVMPVEYRRALAEMAKEKAAAMQAAE
jgi:glutamate synthase (NADPH/NADH) large chain